MLSPKFSYIQVDSSALIRYVGELDVFLFGWKPV